MIHFKYLRFVCPNGPPCAAVPSGVIELIAISIVLGNKEFLYIATEESGFSGLGLTCCLYVPRFAGSNPAEAVRIFQVGKILSTPSFGGEVKPSFPCRRFTACKRFLNDVEIVIKAKFRTFLTHTVPPFATRISRVVTGAEAPGGVSRPPRETSPRGFSSPFLSTLLAVV